jgi:hypothetical protein
MTKFQTIARRSLAATVVVALAALLPACHNNDHDDNHGGGTPPVADNPNPPVATDAFITYVSQQVATLSDTGEPLSTDGVSATAPETTEPLPIPGA